MSRIAVIGAGAWGTAISIVLTRDSGRSTHHQVKLWAFEKEVCESIASVRINQVFLPGCLIPEDVAVTNSLKEALLEAEIVVSAIPSHHCRRMFEGMAAHLRPDISFVSATKGLETDTLLRMSEVITQVVQAKCGFAPGKVAAISGPSFAKEVARGEPTAIAVASADPHMAIEIQNQFSAA